MISDMTVTKARSWRTRAAAWALASLALGAGTHAARADANGGIAAAIGLTAADGSVRTQAGVRLSISGVPGAPDRVLAMSGPVQARMPAIRECFAAALQRSPTTEGRAEFELEASGRGAAKVHVTADETGDAVLVSCMRSSLARAPLERVPRGSRALVGLYLSNPLAALRKRQAQTAQAAADVQMLSGGRAQSEGGTQAGEVKFRVVGSAYAAGTIAVLSRDVSTQLAGLLDCRRKASRHGHDAYGSLEIELMLRDGELAHGAPRGTLKQGAPQCVARWLDRLDTARLGDADLDLAISFSQ